MATNLYADGCAFNEGKYFPIADARIPKRYWEAHDEGPWVTPVDYPN